MASYFKIVDFSTIEPSKQQINVRATNFVGSTCYLKFITREQFNSVFDPNSFTKTTFPVGLDTSTIIDGYYADHIKEWGYIDEGRFLVEHRISDEMDEYIPWIKLTPEDQWGQGRLRNLIEYDKEMSQSLEAIGNATNIHLLNRNKILRGIRNGTCEISGQFMIYEKNILQMHLYFMNQADAVEWKLRHN